MIGESASHGSCEVEKPVLLRDSQPLLSPAQVRGPSELREQAGGQEGLPQPLASPLLLPADTQSFQTQRTGYTLTPPTARSARRLCLTASLSTSRTTSMRPLSWRLTMVRPEAGRCAGWGAVSGAPSATGAPEPLPHPFEARLSQTTRLLLRLEMPPKGRTTVSGGQREQLWPAGTSPPTLWACTEAGAGLGGSRTTTRPQACAAHAWCATESLCMSHGRASVWGHGVCPGQACARGAQE